MVPNLSAERALSAEDPEAKALLKAALQRAKQCDNPSDAAWALLPNPLPTAGNALLFPAPRGGSLSDMTLTAVMRRMQLKAVPHGFRSTFRDWCAEHTDFPREVAEMALAHAIGDKVEAAYRRGDLLAKRQQLMADWARFLGGG